MRATKKCRFTPGPWLLAILLGTGLTQGVIRPGLAQEDLTAPIKFDWPMMSQPVVKTTPVTLSYSPRLVPLWIEALKNSESAVQRQAAQAIYRASFFKVPDLETTIPHLQAVLADSKRNRSTRLAMAHALIQLEARASAPLFLKVAKEGDFELCMLVEPALAAWKDQSVRELWQERLKGSLTNQGATLLAIRQLAAVQEQAVVPRLEEIASDENMRIAYRVEAAKALALLGKTPLIEQADNLLKLPGSALVDRLVAGWLLQQGKTDLGPAEQDAWFEILVQLAADEQTVVARPALQALLTLRPAYLVEQSDRWEKNSDPQVRRAIAQAWLKTAQPQAAHLNKLIMFLNDAKLSVRLEMAAGIKDLYEQEAMRPLLVSLLSQELDRAVTSWRSKEQAMILLVGMEYQPVAKQLAALLDDPEGEVFATAAWGLRKLKAVDQFPAMLRRASEMEEILKESLPEDVAAEDVNEQLGQIFQAFGEMKYAAAMPLLKRCCQKNGMTFPLRSAAVWAVGMIKADDSEPELVKLFSQRILDEDIFNPEGQVVKQTCAIALGRMKSQDAVQLLLDKHNTQENTSRFKWACSWALNQINGHPILEMDDIKVAPGVWFLDVVGLEKEEPASP
jgi:HEAT repeat protein